MATCTISLTPAESLVRRCLLDCRDAMKEKVPQMQSLELRFAGGWVRDKLLGKASHDIDVALSTMTGEQFGEALTVFMQSNGQKYLVEAKSQGIPDIVKGLHTIQKNPELSKHLETATTKLFGLDMDFVNLRKETYGDDSRNPQMEFGEPEEDALRRDATVNALFYHLDKQAVEDFTQRGLSDMQNRIIRTPLEPYQTFRDDPLRVLRLIRFASRLGYQIEATAYESMKDRRIHEALRIKISRERVGVELGKIMMGPDPLQGLMYIWDRDLFETVFANPDSTEYPDTSMVPKIYQSLQTILDQHAALCLVLRPRDEHGTGWFLATYVPWMKSANDAVSAARNGIKASNFYTKVLSDAIKNRPMILEAVGAVRAGGATRSQVGTTLRKAGGNWRFHVLYNLLCDLASEDFATVVERYEQFTSYVHGEQLTDADTLKPIINGNEIKAALGIQKAGSWLKSTIDVVVAWQFEHPTATADDAKAMIASKREELNIS